MFFFSDIDNQKIWKWSPGGGAETAVAGVWTHHLFVDAADNLYYETEIYQGEWGNSFWPLSPDGNSTTLVSPTLDRDAYWGEHTLVDAAGSIFFRGARRIRKRSPDGQVEILADGLADITALAWGPDESIYVVDGDALRRIGLNDQITTLASKSRAMNPTITSATARITSAAFQGTVNRSPSYPNRLPGRDHVTHVTNSSIAVEASQLRARASAGPFKANMFA